MGICPKNGVFLYVTMGVCEQLCLCVNREANAGNLLISVFAWRPECGGRARSHGPFSYIK